LSKGHKWQRVSREELLNIGRRNVYALPHTIRLAESVKRRMNRLSETPEKVFKIIYFNTAIWSKETAGKN